MEERVYCLGCIHGDIYREDLICRKSPPMATDDVMYAAVWPRVSANDWCSEADDGMEYVEDDEVDDCPTKSEPTTSERP